jgi:hypothetical protein
MPKSSEARKLEHIDSRINHVLFDGTMDTCPYVTGDLYEGRPILGISMSKTVYGWNYSLVVEGDQTHAKTRFTFDQKHDLIFTKPLDGFVTKLNKDIEMKLPSNAV